MTEPQFFATATGGRKHLAQCPHLLDKVVLEVPVSDERPVCDGCQKEIAGHGRTYFDDLDAALDVYRAPVENRHLIKQHLADVVFDQIWMPYSDSYVALGRQGRGVAWTGKNYVEPVPGTRVLLPGYAGAQHGAGQPNPNAAWGPICPETFIAHPVNGACPDCGSEAPVHAGP